MNQEYTFLTDTKYQKFIESLNATKEDQNYYNIICIKNFKDQPELSRNIKLYLYKCHTNYLFERSRKFQIIYEINGKFYEVILHKFRVHASKRIKNELRKYNDPIIKEMLMASKNYSGFKWNNRTTYVYINYDIKEMTDVNDLKNIPLCERIDLDLTFDVYNEAEVEIFYKKKILDLLNFTFEYDDIDIDNMINEKEKKFNFAVGNYSNYKISLDFFNGTKYDSNSSNTNAKNIAHDAKKCYEILYPREKYHGIEKIWYGYTGYYQFDNYVLILHKHNENNRNQYMYVHYCIDNSTCAGFIFSLKTRVYSSLEKLWNDLHGITKSRIIKKNLGIKSNAIYVDPRSESEVETTYSDSDTD